MYKRSEGFDEDRPPAEAKQHPKMREPRVNAENTIGSGSEREVYPQNTMGSGREGFGGAQGTIGSGSERMPGRPDNDPLPGGDVTKHSGTIAD
jgi:hypothetical protein